MNCSENNALKAFHTFHKVFFYLLLVLVCQFHLSIMSVYTHYRAAFMVPVYILPSSEVLCLSKKGEGQFKSLRGRGKVCFVFDFRKYVVAFCFQDKQNKI